MERSLARCRRAVRQVVSRALGWSLADQALVSGCNFAIGVLLARHFGVAGFGTYVIAQTCMQYANTFQSALVVSPMFTAIPLERNPTAQHELLRGFFAYTIAVLLTTSVGVLLVAWTLSRWLPALALDGLGLPLGVAMISFQVQDWLRRALYVNTADHAVFLGDLMAYGGQGAALAFLAWHGELGLGVALWVLAGSFALSAAGIAAALKLSPDFGGGVTVMRAHWRSSRDYLLFSQWQWLAVSGVILIGTGFIGVRAAGAIRAAQNLLGPVNVLFQWMDNVISVRAALCLRDGGRQQLARFLNRLNWIGLVAFGLFALLSMAIDGWLMDTVYGPDYRPFAVLIVLQAIYNLLSYLYRMQTYYHRVLGNTGVVARSSFWWALVSASCAVMTVNVLAERGIMMALLVGEATGLLYLLWVKRESEADTTDTADKYLQWQWRGRMRLVLPVANRRVLSGALNMYVPSTRTGRLYRRLLGIGLPVLARTGRGQSFGGTRRWAVDLPRLAEMVPG
ncbi:MAG: hypothetical protein ABI661_09030, partial [Gammaproteobacteria bacterium]